MQSAFGAEASTHLLHLAPGLGDILAKGKVELDLPIGRLDTVLLQWQNTLRSINLEVDLRIL